MSNNRIPPVNIIFNGRVGDMYHYAAFVSFPYNPSINDINKASELARLALIGHLPGMVLEMDEDMQARYTVSVGPYGKCVVLTTYGCRIDNGGDGHVQGVTVED
jgi:hypothetical protein